MGRGTVEQRIKKLTNELRALKSTYKTSGSATNFYVQTSEEMSVPGDEFEVSFTPDYGRGQNNLISLRVVIRDENGFVVPTYRYAIEPQDRSGDVVVKVVFLYGEVEQLTMQLIATGTSPGTFQVLDEDVV